MMSDQVLLGFTDEETLKKERHHPIVLFHLLFRCAAIVLYILCGWFIDSFITSFVLIVLLLSADFWTVKNITGRLLVGLRWWNYVDPDGKSHWVFESRKGDQQGVVNPSESKIFWTALIVTPLVWLLFFFIAFFRFNFKWFMVVIIALVLNGANLYGYTRCKLGKTDLKSSVTGAVTGLFQKQLFQNMGSFLSRGQQQPSPATTI